MSTMSVVLSLLMMVSISIAGIPTISALKCSYFTHQETIYIDMRNLSEWDESGANIRVYTYYGDTDADWNVENNKADSDCYTNACFQHAITPSSVVNDVYSFNIQGDKVGYVKVLRLDSGMTTVWNTTGFAYNRDRGGSANCIKITGWDNSYQWTTYSSSGGTGYHEVTAVPDATSITNNSNIYTIDATFYDYYTDGEIQRGWGDINYVESHGDWEPYTTLNNKIASASSGVNFPMYFGNFYDKNDGYAGAGNSNMVNFSNWVNNSARLGGNHKSVVGLTGSTLVNGQLKYAVNGGGNSTVNVPFFDKSFLQNNGVGSVVNTKFPMRKVISNGITSYKFDSEGAGDNAWLSADRKTIYYGQGTSKGSKDALYYYSNPKENSGYGFFPFDSNRGADKEAYDFGFGMRTDIKFNLGADDSSHLGQIKGTDNNYVDQVFNFTGDDDLWVYVDGKLILDLGGDHKKAQGSINFHTKTVTVSTGSNTLNSATRNTSFTLSGDPTAEHTLTMFYVERGMVESNLSFNFNFAPVGNEFIVDKTVNTTNINAGIQSAVAAADTFTFTQPTAAGKVSSKGTIGSDGKYTLKDGGRISFKDQFTRGQEFTVTESESSPLDYTTTWSAKDLVMNESRGSGNSKEANFTYDTSNTSEFAMTRVQLSYVNTPTKGDVAVTKTVADGTGDDLTKEFDGTVTVSLDGGNTYSEYPLVYSSSDNATQNYTLSSTGALVSGAKLKHGRTLTFKDLPAGAIVKVEENFDQTTATLYSFTSATGDDVTQSGNGGYFTVSSGSTKTMTITNTPIPPESTTQTISGAKTLDDQAYTGNLFYFQLRGLKLSGDIANAKDTSSVSKTVRSTTNGSFTFGSITYSEAGVYRYYVYEDLSNLQNLDNANGTTYHEDIYQNLNVGPKYLVTITVTRNGANLVASSPVIVTTDKEISALVPADFSGTSVPLRFENKTRPCSVTIDKSNQAGEKVQDVTFALYKLSEDDAEELETYSDSDKYDYIAANGTLVAEDQTNENGVAEFENLKIYEDGYASSSAPKYQNYALIETGGNADYRINKVPQIFTFPTYDNNAQELKYDYTFSYENGMIKNPYTAGNGMMIFRTIGLILIGLALLTLAGFVIYKEKFSLSRAKNARHYKK